MAAASAPVLEVADRIGEDDKGTGAGWIGSLAGVRGAFVTVDANGFITQAVAAGAAVATATKVGILCDDVASTVAAASADALAIKYRSCKETSEITLALVNNSDTLITPANTDVGTTIGLYRRSTGEYVADRNGTVTFFIERVDIAAGTVTGRIVPAVRL